MQLASVILMLAAISGVALAVPSSSEAADRQQYDAELAAWAQKLDVIDYGLYRSGMIDNNDLLVRVATAFNDAAYRGISACTETKKGNAHTETCQLKMPVLDIELCAEELVIDDKQIVLTLIVGGNRIQLKTMSLDDFTYNGLKVSITKYISSSLPPPLSTMANMLVAEIIITGTNNPGNGTATITHTFRVGMQAPFGMPVPGMPAPAEIPLTSRVVNFELPEKTFVGKSMNFFKRVIRAVTFGYVFAS